MCIMSVYTCTHACMDVCVYVTVDIYARPHTCMCVHMGRSQFLDSDCPGPH